MEELPKKILSCFAVIIEDNPISPRIYLVHNKADQLGPNGEKGKPAGCGLPGGGAEEGETPLDAVYREVRSEIGLETEIATAGKYETKEILFESKPVTDMVTGNLAVNEIYVFHLKRTGFNGFGSIKEIDETGRWTLAALGDILTMPLARKTTKNPDGTSVISENPEGIYFSTRERIFGALEYLGYDFYRLIPDLDKLFLEIKREDVGDYVYNLLAETVRKKNEAYERRAWLLRPDLDDPYEIKEIIDRYTDPESWHEEEETYVNRGR